MYQKKHLYQADTQPCTCNVKRPSNPKPETSNFTYLKYYTLKLPGIPKRRILNIKLILFQLFNFINQ
jgi:hypothetical protein